MTPDEARKVALTITNRTKAALRATDSGMVWQALWDEIATALLAAAAQQREEDARIVERHVLQATDDEAGLARAIKYIAAAIREKP